MQGVCHLLTNIAVYCNLNDSTYELPEEDDYNNEQEFHDLLGDADMDLDTTTALYQKYRHESGVEAHVGESSVLHLSPQRPMYGFLEGMFLVFTCVDVVQLKGGWIYSITIKI